MGLQENGVRRLYRETRRKTPRRKERRRDRRKKERRQESEGKTKTRKQDEITRRSGREAGFREASPSDNGILYYRRPTRGIHEAISPIARDLSKIHARSGLGTRLVSLCTSFPALGVDSVRHAHDFRAMRFCLPIRLGMAITFALASHSVRYTQHFRFMRFRPVRLQNGMEIIECLVPFAPLFSARSRARRLR